MSIYRGTPGKPSSDAKILKAIKLLRERNQQPPGKRLSYAEIAAQVGVWSENTIRNWEAQDMTPHGRAKRIAKRAHNRVLTEEEEQIVAGWIVWKTKHHQNTSTRHVKAFVRKAFGKVVNDTWLSRFCHRQHFSDLLPLHGLHSSAEEVDVKTGVLWIQNLRTKRVSTHHSESQLLAIDKTKVYMETSGIQQIAPTGRFAQFFVPLYLTWVVDNHEGQVLNEDMD